MKIKLVKFNDKLKTPERAHYNDAGLDCYALEDFTIYPKGKEYKTWNSDINDYEIKKLPYMLKIPLGFGLEIPDGYMATIRPRSSMNAKGIITQIGTIDSGYRGEISAIFINDSEQHYHFEAGDKICQIVIEPVILADVVEELNNDRGKGGFGSTGR